jgi:hypothetical protein
MDSRTKPVALDASDASRDRLVDMIRATADHAVGFRGYGNSWHGFVKEDGQTQQFNFNCKLYFSPPRSIHLVSHATMHGNINMGCNTEEFWLAIKPEIGTYYWGRWDRALDRGLMPFNPRVVLEGIGLVDMGDANDWSLEEEDKELVLTHRLPVEGLIKQIVVEPESGQIVRIQYLDPEWVPLVVAQLAGHRIIAKDFSVPTVIRVTVFKAGQRVGWVKVVLKTFPLGEPPARLLERPDTRGFKNVIEVTESQPEG